MSTADTTARLQRAGLEATGNRVLALDAVLEAETALTPPQLMKRLAGRMNRVTLYRILDLLVDAGLIQRHSGAGRAYHYCAGQGHGHFHCTRCGTMLCMRLPDGALDLVALGIPAPQDTPSNASPGRVDAVELRLDGVCEKCLHRSP